MYKDLTQNLSLEIHRDNTRPYSWNVIVTHILPRLHNGVKPKWHICLYCFGLSPEGDLDCEAVPQKCYKQPKQRCML